MRNLLHNFDQYLKLAMWRLQLLDHRTLLLCMAPPAERGEGNAPAAGAPGVPPSQAAPSRGASQFYLVYDLQESRVLAFYRNTSEALLRLFLCHTPAFQSDAGAPPWQRFAQDLRHVAHAQQQLLNLGAGGAGSSSSGSNGDSGDAAAVVRKLLQMHLPACPQLISPSPYLDPRIFMCVLSLFLHLAYWRL